MLIWQLHGLLLWQPNNWQPYVECTEGGDCIAEPGTAKIQVCGDPEGTIKEPGQDETKFGE